jgi:L-lysine exporter family protein LysE/ArgO
VLIALGVSGFGTLESRLPGISTVLLYGGVIFLVVYGARSAWAACGGSDDALTAADGPTRGLIPTLATCLALTWLNPHVYLDTVVFLGSISTNYGAHRWTFGTGAMLSSLVFFFSLAYGARLLAPLFARPIAWRVLDAAIALVMWGIAIKLLSME